MINPAVTTCAVTDSVTVTDANGCTATATVTITDPAPFTASASGTSPLCAGASNGTARSEVCRVRKECRSLWADDQSINTAVALKAGTHSVTVTDANGCT